MEITRSGSPESQPETLDFVISARVTWGETSAGSGRAPSTFSVPITAAPAGTACLA